MDACSKAWWVCSLSLAGIVGSNAAGGIDCVSVSVVCCQVEVSAKGLITCPEESYRVWCI